MQIHTTAVPRSIYYIMHEKGNLPLTTDQDMADRNAPET
jgi:hypothetical protein